MNTPPSVHTKRQLAQEMEKIEDPFYLNILTSLSDKEVIQILSESDPNSPQPPPLKRQRPFYSRADKLIQELNENYVEIAEI